MRELIRSPGLAALAASVILLAGGCAADGGESGTKADIQEAEPALDAGDSSTAEPLDAADGDEDASESKDSVELSDPAKTSADSGDEAVDATETQDLGSDDGGEPDIWSTAS
jgi:hypothetical protein